QELSFPGPGPALDLMTSAVEELSAEVDRDRVWGVGVGFPGPLRIGAGVVDNIINPAGFPGWENVSMREQLSDRLEFSVFLENNATAAAMGESYYGAGSRLESYFYVFLGVGLGGAIIQNGRPIRGWQGNAGEVGFMPTLPATGSGEYLGRHFDLFRLYQMLTARHGDIDTMTAVVELLERGDVLVNSWLGHA